MYRTRRLRKTENIRRLVRENKLSVDDLIYPLFIQEGKGIETEIQSMPGIKKYSLDKLSKELNEITALNIQAVLLFGVPATKDHLGTETWNDKGIIQQAIQFIKKNYPNLYIITDVCFCEYTTYGYCGVVKDNDIDNDATLVNIAKQALSHAKAGADMLAPSGMMDGTVLNMRKALDSSGFYNLPIMGYSVKYSSALYGPFREAVDAEPLFGHRKSHQIDPSNRNEGLRKALFDSQEGVDILMVKPALLYLDIIRDLKNKFNLPVACYNVSGEYAMIKAAAEKAWIDGKQVMIESLLSMKRAGADIIITYFAKQAARILNKHEVKKQI
ncbi:MAG: porphobilinogen synthase [Tenacibaculum sp.]